MARWFLLLAACAPSAGTFTVSGEPLDDLSAGSDGSTANTALSGAWESECPELARRAECQVVGSVGGDFPHTTTTWFDALGREVVYEDDMNQDGVWDLRVSTEWAEGRRIETQELRGDGVIRRVSSMLRDDGQLQSSTVEDLFEGDVKERELTYDGLGRVVTDIWRSNGFRLESCTSEWTDFSDSRDQVETCRSGTGDSVAVRSWSVKTRLPLALSWNRDGVGAAEWVAETTYLDDCQVQRDEQVLPPGDGYDRFVTESDYDAGLAVRTVVTAVDDDGEFEPVDTITDFRWTCE
ncbi:MAG: hypothetical protein ACI8PZ_001319 [Myxococcota bacterium]|jgi:hypothetical protein